jgi:CRP-like cAMP-binding protein/cytochrome P450
MAERPPMCPGTWLLGNARALLDDTAGAITDGYRQRGPVFRVRAAWRTYTIVAGAEASEFMALGLGPAHLSRERLFGPIAREFGRADLILKEIGPAHARLRPALALPYSRQVASAHVPALMDVVGRLVREWPEGVTGPAVRETKRLAFEMYRVLIGRPEIAFPDCLRMTDYLMNVAARQLPPFVLRLPWYRASHRRTYGAITDLVRARRDRPAGDGPPTIVDALWAAHDAQGTPFTEDEVVGYAAYGIGASIGYVGRLTAFMLYEILRDPDLHEALRREVRDGVARGIDDAAAVLTLLRSVYDETLRLHSLAIGLPFDVVADIDFLGHRIRRGDALVVSPVPTSYDPALFPEPGRFDPERCRPPRLEHRRPGACMPFGLGDRRCAAMGLVELMSMVLVGTVLHERGLAMDPPDYRLRRSTHPLPSPDRRFRLRVSAGARRPVGEATSVVASEEALFSAFPGHEEPTVQATLTAARRETFAPGQVILRQGDAADTFHLIEQGDVVVSRAGDGASREIARLGPGQWFGEVGLLQRAPRNATVTAADTGAVTRVIDGESFLAMVASSDLVASEIGQLLRRRAATGRLMDSLPRLTPAMLAAVLPEFAPRHHAPGDVLIAEGDSADEFFVLVTGHVDVTRLDPQGTPVALATLGPGDYFGEMGLLNRAPRNATVRASMPVEVLVTDRAGFDRLLAEGDGAAGALAQAILARTHRLAS